MRRLPASCNILLGFHALENYGLISGLTETTWREEIGRESIGRHFFPTRYRSPVSSLTSCNRCQGQRGGGGDKRGRKSKLPHASLSVLSHVFFLGFHLWIGFCLEQMCSRPGQIPLHQPTSPYQSQNKIMPPQHTQASILLDPSPQRCCRWKNVVGLTSVHKFGPCLHAPLFCLLCWESFFTEVNFFYWTRGDYPLMIIY
jgi:hypothetical protein